MCGLIDNKANIDDINKALNEIHQELELKACKNEIQNFLKEQTIINESICSENIIGRWVWKSGSLKKGNLVPWENQVINTQPDNFIWEKNKCSIGIKASGTY